MLCKRWFFAIALLSCFFAAASARAADPSTLASAPPASQSSSGAMKVYITEVTGLVQVRDSDDQPWEAARVKMILTQGAELRTGPHSSVTCVIPPDQTFTLDRLGTVRVEEAAQHGSKITTELMMKYGRTRYDIEAAGLEHEASISSPSSTLAVRGTRVSLYDQPPFAPEGISFTGRAKFTNGSHTTYVGHKDGSVTRVIAGKDSPADTAYDGSVIDPSYADSRTAADAELIASEISRGASLSFDSVANIPVITGGRPYFDSELPSHLPGPLDFVLRWTGNTTLNLEVGVDKGDPLTNILNGFQQGEFLFPGFGFQNSPSGGHIPFADHGGPTGGEEFAYWSGAFPTGLYGIAAVNSGKVSTSFTFDVYANGVPLNMYYFASDGATLIKSTQETRTLAPGAVQSAIIPIPAIPLLESVIPDDPAGNPNPGITPASFSSKQIKAALRAANPAPSKSITPAPLAVASPRR